jgi:hypothetical protein
LESMFPSNSYKEKYQKIGWMNKSKGKKNWCITKNCSQNNWTVRDFYT